MGLYKLFSYNLEVQYKGCLMSKAMLFTCITTLLNLIIPFILAYRSRGFWLKSHRFYEQPTVHFIYDYILILETDDPSFSIVCADTRSIDKVSNEEYCSEFQVKELDWNNDGKNEQIQFQFELIVPRERTITALVFLPILDFQLKTTCPLHMQSMSLVEKDFVHSPSSLKYYGDLSFYQTAHLPCVKNNIHTKFNYSLLDNINDDCSNNVINDIINNYFIREVTTRVDNVYSRTQNGHKSHFELMVTLRIPEVEIRYKPSLMQELKWAWLQYLSLVIIFYWIFNKITCFVFSNRLLMVWKVDPWKRDKI